MDLNCEHVVSIQYYVFEVFVFQHPVQKLNVAQVFIVFSFLRFLSAFVLFFFLVFVQSNFLITIQRRLALTNFHGWSRFILFFGGFINVSWVFQLVSHPIEHIVHKLLTNLLSIFLLHCFLLKLNFQLYFFHLTVSYFIFLLLNFLFRKFFHFFHVQPLRNLLWIYFGVRIF